MLTSILLNRLALLYFYLPRLHGHRILPGMLLRASEELLIPHVFPPPPTARPLTYTDYYGACETLTRQNLPGTPLAMPAGPNITQLYERTCQIDPGDGQGLLGNVHSDPIMAAEPGTPLAASLIESPNIADEVVRTSIDPRRLYGIVRRVSDHAAGHFGNRAHYRSTTQGIYLSTSLVSQIPEPVRPRGFGLRMLQVSATALRNAI